MEPKSQLTSDNNYTPSKRAAAAVRTAQGMNHGAPDKPDTSPNMPEPAAAKMPKNPAGGKVPKEPQQGSDTLDGGTGRGAVSGGPVEKGSI